MKTLAFLSCIPPIRVRVGGIRVRVGVRVRVRIRVRAVAGMWKKIRFQLRFRCLNLTHHNRQN